MRLNHRALVLGFLLVAVGVVLATTWATVESECPVCHKKNSYNEIMSYGSYIYSWPSKFQDVYWPATDGSSLYSCKHCYLTLFMWDYRKLPSSKVDDVRRALAHTSMDGKYQKYTEIPMSKRLEIAERVYSVLDKDDQFWAWFYRVQGYHLALEKKPEQASMARAKALEHTRTLLDDSANAGKRKQFLLDSAAMHHFLGDDMAAKGELSDALKTTFEDPKLSAEQNKNVNNNLDGLIKEYLERIDKKTVPRDDGTDKKDVPAASK